MNAAGNQYCDKMTTVTVIKKYKINNILQRVQQGLISYSM